MSYIIDRRRNSKNKSTVNRQRFLDRYKKHIKKAVTDAVNSRSIKDLERGEDIVIPGDDISEPVFQHGSGGRRSVVHPGNKEFVAGDRIPRPEGGGERNHRQQIFRNRKKDVLEHGRSVAGDFFQRQIFD